jgi:hypothetical protein
MYQRLVLDALAQAARGGEDHLARETLKGTDPLVRARLRSRVAERIALASASVVDRTDRGHVLRLAFLQEARLADDLDAEDREAVRGAFEKASAAVTVEKKHRLWFASMSLGLALVAAAAIAFRITHPPAPFSPLTTPLGDALGPTLTRYVVSVHHEAEERRNGAPSGDEVAASHDAVMAKLDRALGLKSDPFQRLFASYQDLAFGKRSDAATREAFESSLQQANASLHAAHKPYLVDVLEDAAGIFLISSYIAKERAVKAEGITIRLLQAQRLDSLNLALAAVGYTRPQLGAAVVTLDMLEREIVAVVAPALVAGGRARMVDPKTEESEDWAEPLERRAAELLQKDYAAVRSAAIDRLIELLAKRDHLYWQFRRATAFTNVAVYRPTRVVSRGDTSVLDGRVPGSALREWQEVNDELDGAPMREAFDELLERYSEPIERHEVQHQIDFRRGLVVVPAPLREILGMPETMDVEPWSAAARCREELSADLASIATTEKGAVTALVLSQEALFDRSLWGTPHAYGAAVILTSMAAELDMPAGDSLLARGQFDRRRAKDLLFAIAEQPRDAISAAARAAYQTLFGVVPPHLDFEAWKAARPWRK